MYGSIVSDVNFDININHNMWILSKDFQLNCYSKASSHPMGIQDWLSTWTGGSLSNRVSGENSHWSGSKFCKGPASMRWHLNALLSANHRFPVKLLLNSSRSKFKNWFHLGFYPCEKSVWKFWWLRLIALSVNGTS